MSDDGGSEVHSEHRSEVPEDTPRTSVKKSAGGDEEPEHMVSFSSYQLFVFVACYFGYCIMLYNRKAFTFSLPHVIMEEYFSSYEIGMIMSAQTIAYTISKFFFSWATDHYSPRYMFAGGMFFTGFVMLAFSDQEDWPNIMLLTAANGLAQGLGWPAVTKMIRAWFPPTQFGFWFATLASTSNLIGTLGPGLASSLATSYGWRTAIQIPAFLAVLCSVAIPYCTWDKPSDVGYEDQSTIFGTSEGHWSDLAGSEFMFFLASSFGLLFVVKTCCQDWGQVYLLQERGLSAYAASGYLTAMEIGGLVGSIFAGTLTDLLIRKGVYFGTGKSPRMIVVMLCGAGSCMFLNLFLFTIDPDTTKGYMSALGFLMGFCLYGALSLIGTIAVEVAPIHITGSAHAVIGIAAGLGAIIAGVPISAIANAFDWFTAFMIVNLMCFGVFSLLVLGKDTKATFLQKGGGPAKLRVA